MSEMMPWQLLLNAPEEKKQEVKEQLMDLEMN